jgi:membrane-associated phospholipid phosphatase
LSVEIAPTMTSRFSRRRLTVARIITEVSGPAVCAVTGLLVVAIRNAGSGVGAAWGGFAALFVAGIPMGYIAKGVKAGKWSDHHVADRTKRAVPLLIALASVAVCAALLAAVDAPQELVALVLAMLAGLAVVLAVTHWWKVSIHAAVAGGLLGIFVILFGPWALLGLPMLAAVAWSRTVLDAHTWPQVAVGALLGAAVAAAVFPPLR